MKERSDAYLNPPLLYLIESMKMSFAPLDLILQSHIQRTNTFQENQANLWTSNSKYKQYELHLIIQDNRTKNIKGENMYVLLLIEKDYN